MANSKDVNYVCEQKKRFFRYRSFLLNILVLSIFLTGCSRSYRIDLPIILDRPIEHENYEEFYYIVETPHGSRVRFTENWRGIKHSFRKPDINKIMFCLKFNVENNPYIVGLIDVHYEYASKRIPFVRFTEQYMLVGMSVIVDRRLHPDNTDAHHENCTLGESSEFPPGILHR